MRGIDSYFSKSTKKPKPQEPEVQKIPKKKKKHVISSSDEDEEPELKITTDYKKNKINSDKSKVAIKSTNSDYFSSFGGMKKVEIIDKRGACQM